MLLNVHLPSASHAHEVLLQIFASYHNGVIRTIMTNTTLTNLNGETARAIGIIDLATHQTLVLEGQYLLSICG